MQKDTNKTIKEVGGGASEDEQYPDQLLSYRSLRDARTKEKGRAYTIAYVTPSPENWIYLFARGAGERLVHFGFELHIAGRPFNKVEMETLHKLFGPGNSVELAAGGDIERLRALSDLIKIRAVQDVGSTLEQLKKEVDERKAEFGWAANI